MPATAPGDTSARPDGRGRTSLRKWGRRLDRALERRPENPPSRALHTHVQSGDAALRSGTAKPGSRQAGKRGGFLSREPRPRRRRRRKQASQPIEQSGCIRRRSCRSCWRRDEESQIVCGVNIGHRARFFHHRMIIRSTGADGLDVGGGDRHRRGGFMRPARLAPRSEAAGGDMALDLARRDAERLRGVGFGDPFRLRRHGARIAPIPPMSQVSSPARSRHPRVKISENT